MATMAMDLQRIADLIETMLFVAFVRNEKTKRNED